MKKSHPIVRDLHIIDPIQKVVEYSIRKSANSIKASIKHTLYSSNNIYHILLGYRSGIVGFHDHSSKNFRIFHIDTYLQPGDYFFDNAKKNLRWMEVVNK